MKQELPKQIDPFINPINEGYADRGWIDEDYLDVMQPLPDNESLEGNIILVDE